MRCGDGAGARVIFERGLAEATSGEVIEGLANAAYLELDYAPAIDGLERAYSVYRDTGDNVGAARAARSVAYLHGTIVGDPAVMRGWLARAETLLGGAMESREGGWVTLSLGMFESDRARKDDFFRTSIEVARRFGDNDLELVTLAYLGASLVHADRVEEGMLLLDEALAAVAGREVDDFVVLQEIFCQLFAACEHAHDITRADQWIRIGDAIAERRQLPAVSAFCRTHYGGLLTTAGRWPKADTALTEAVRLWGSRPSGAARWRIDSVGGSTRPPGPLRGSPTVARRARSRRRGGAAARGDSPVERPHIAREKHARAIDVFRVERHGRLSDAAVVNSEPGTVPFAVTFDRGGNLVVSEAATSSVATYGLHHDKTITLLDRVLTGQAATCWIVGADQNFYASNAGSGSLSRIASGQHGALTFIDNTATGAGTVDAAVSANGRYLYVQTGTAGNVDGFRINGDSSLTQIGSVTVPGGVGGEDIVAI